MGQTQPLLLKQHLPFTARGVQVLSNLQDHILSRLRNLSLLYYNLSERSEGSILCCNMFLPKDLATLMLSKCTEEEGMHYNNEIIERNESESGMKSWEEEDKELDDNT